MVHIYNIYNFALKNRVRIVKKYQEYSKHEITILFAHYLRYIFKNLPCSAIYRSLYLNQSKDSSED